MREPLQTPPEQIVADLGAFLAVLPEDEQARLRDIMANRRRVQQVSDYHQQLLARVASPDTDLPPIKHPTYRILGGFHEQLTPESLAECAKKNDELRERAKELGVPFNANGLANPRKKVYQRGQTVTPVTDGEALLMLQNPDKFQKLGIDNPVDQVSQLLAENAQYKQRIAELEGQITDG